MNGSSAPSRYAALEAFERHVEHRARLVLVTELLVRGAEPCVQLDQDPALQRVIGLAEEIDLAREVLDRVRVPALQRRQMTRAHVARRR